MTCHTGKKIYLFTQSLPILEEYRSDGDRTNGSVTCSIAGPHLSSKTAIIRAACLSFVPNVVHRHCLIKYYSLCECISRSFGDSPTICPYLVEGCTVLHQQIATNKFIVMWQPIQCRAQWVKDASRRTKAARESKSAADTIARSKQSLHSPP